MSDNSPAAWHRDRALVWATPNKKIGKSTYTIIDQTEIGSRLDKFKRDEKELGVYKYFKSYYGDEKIGDVFLHNVYGRKVMEFASAAFVGAAKGGVEAIVYGATPAGVFYTTELPALMRNDNITSINGVDMDKLRKVYGNGDEAATYKTFKKICQGGLALARKRMKACDDEGKTEFHAEYVMHRTYFLAERRETLGKAKETIVGNKADNVQMIMSSEDRVPVLPVPHWATPHYHSHSHGAGIQ